MRYDLIDGGIPATFLDGPKVGHLGVVTPDEDVPPRTLVFLDDLVYVRAHRMKVDAHDANGQPRRYRGVGYRVDPACGFVRRMNIQIQLAKDMLAAGEVETQ